MRTTGWLTSPPTVAARWTPAPARPSPLPVGAAAPGLGSSRSTAGIDGWRGHG
jgi:hypothetical protein